MNPQTRILLLQLLRATLVAVLLTLALWVLDTHGVGLKLLGAMMALIGAVAWFTPQLGVRMLDVALHWGRYWFWRDRHGTHHAFGDVLLDIEAQGGAIWIEAEGLRRVMDVWEPDLVFATRLTKGLWRRDGRRWWLRVDAVVQYLQEAPDRMDPRRISLRLYLEREVLFPFRERRRRTDPSRPPRR